MLRRNTTFPKRLSIELCSFLRKIWEEGWLDDYSNNHFLIMALENRLVKFSWIEQFLNNNVNCYFNFISKDGIIDYEAFSYNFCINFSQKLQAMYYMFGAHNIEKFIIDQLSAGKVNYDENLFFQALSEIEVLTFFHRGFGWSEIKYEPHIGQNGANPEAYFIGDLCGNNSNIKANIEVKTPSFPSIESRNKDFIIPTVLLSKQGRIELLNFCKKNNIELILPRVSKLVDLINSATKKFSFHKENEFNLLYINWSYSDFPSNGFLEAWNLLTNEINGILVHPEIAKSLSLREPISLDAYKKISAIIVYNSSIEQLMFTDFRHVWQTNNYGCKFRMYVLDDKLINDKNNILFKLTSMNPSHKDKTFSMLCCTSKAIERNIKLYNKINEIIRNNMLLIDRS